MAQTFQRGKTHWCKLRWPEHPKADQEGRVRLPLSTDKRLAEIKLGELLKQRDAHKRGFTPVETGWGPFRSRYELTLQKMSHSTQMAHRRALNEMESSVAYLKDVRQFTPGILDDLHTALVTKNLGPYMIVKIIKSVKAIMRKAEIWGITPPQEWKAIKTRRLPRGRVDFYTHMELKSLLNKFDGLWLTAIWLGAKAGLRPAEMFHLHEDAVDIKGRKIVIRETKCYECLEKFHPKGLWTPKNGKMRVVTMKDDLAKYLEWRKKNLKGEWLISEYSSWRPSFEGFTNTLGYKLRTALRGFAYTLRHTYGTHEIQRGMDIRRVRDELGHDSITTTEIYLHLPPACDCAPPCAPE